MLFNSIQFFIFFPVVTIVYFIIPHKFRYLLLLFVSCIFYMAFIPIYILILFLTILIDYFAGILIEKDAEDKKKLYLIISIVSTCLVLFIFKYFNFFNINLSNIANLLHWNYSIQSLSIILPIGLSFHTFQSLSYVIEVYKGNQKAERNFLIYALYVMFYPQLVAGPIERPQNLLHQFYEKHEPNYNMISNGLKLMLLGFFEKIVIADNLAGLVNKVYDTPQMYHGLPLIVATIFFAIQIYCDFAGYSNIAIGAARVMGFKLMRNFNVPYFSKSISEFWKRWHISLSTWFRDYVYIPLGGNRVPKLRLYLNLFITFAVSGLWHGARWNFVIWGSLNGVYLIIGIFKDNIKTKIKDILSLKALPSLNNYLKVFITFSLICFSWIFFRANNISDSIYIFKNLFVNLGNLKDLKSYILSSELSILSLFVLMCSIFLLFIFEIIQAQKGINIISIIKPLWARLGIYYFLVMLILIFGSFGVQKFIYFQF